MNINRHNYEEFFLLYADNELSAAERCTVEEFVMQNPDLQEELTLLLSSVVKADNTILFENKISLVREEESMIQDLEEKFLLYHDNELSLSEKKETQEMLLTNASLKNEFDLLQQVKFAPDTSIVFPDKNLLYKKDRKVLYLNWRKALAAAILLGAGLWTGITYLEKDKTKTNNNTAAKTIKNTNTTKPGLKTDSLNYATIPAEKTKIANEKISKNITVVQTKINKTKKETISPVVKLNSGLITKIPLIQKDIAIILPKKENIITDQVKIITTEKTIATLVEDRNADVAPQNNIKTASYIMEDAVKSENYVFYNITQEEFNKSKIGTFLKKVKRVIERKNPLRDKSFKVSNIPTSPEN